jgi:hypothetical protein
MGQAEQPVARRGSRRVCGKTTSFTRATIARCSSQAQPGRRIAGDAVAISELTRSVREVAESGAVGSDSSGGTSAGAAGRSVEEARGTWRRHPDAAMRSMHCVAVETISIRPPSKG